MQVWIDVKFMHTDFDGYGLSGFGDTATLKNDQNSLSDRGHQKIESIGVGSKNSCKYGLMLHACTPILVGVVFSVSEILLPSKTTKIPFRTMDYSPWSSKKLNRSELAQKIHASMD